MRILLWGFKGKVHTRFSIISLVLLGIKNKKIKKILLCSIFHSHGVPQPVRRAQQSCYRATHGGRIYCCWMCTRRAHQCSLYYIWVSPVSVEAPQPGTASPCSFACEFWGLGLSSELCSWQRTVLFNGVERGADKGGHSSTWADVWCTSARTRARTRTHTPRLMGAGLSPVRLPVNADSPAGSPIFRCHVLSPSTDAQSQPALMTRGRLQWLLRVVNLRVKDLNSCSCFCGPAL